MRGARKVKVVVEFPTEQAALDWFTQIQEAGAVPEDVDLHEADGLDMPHGGGSGTYLVKRVGDRPWGRLRDKLRR
jgi:hypothetical protein